MEKLIQIAERIGVAKEALSRAQGCRRMFELAGCHDLTGWDRRIGIRLARLYMLTYALQQEITGTNN